MMTNDTTVGEELAEVQRRCESISFAFDSLASRYRIDRFLSRQIMNWYKASHASLPNQAIRALADARPMGPVTLSVGSLGVVAAPTAAEWLVRYAREVEIEVKHQARMVCGPWWPEWFNEHDAAACPLPVEYVVELNEETEPLFSWWREKSPWVKAEIEWEMRRAICQIDRRQSPFESVGLSHFSHITFGNWTRPPVASGPVSPPPSEPASPPPKRRVTIEEANTAIMEIAARDRGQILKMSLRSVAKRVGCSPATVKETNIWTMTHPANGKSRRPKAVPLTPELGATLGTTDSERADELNDLLRDQERDIKSEGQPRRKSA